MESRDQIYLSVTFVPTSEAGGKMSLLKELPVGYRFNPSDEVLVNYHLKRKLSNIEEEHCSIPEFDIYKLPPWDLITKFNDLSDLASDGQECFFYHRWNDPSSKRHNRRTKEGFWKDTGGNQKPRVTDQTKWHKKILVYRLGTQKSAVETEWAMHEYQDISNPAIVACRIHKIKPKKVKARVDSGSSKAWSDGSCYKAKEGKIEPPEVSQETLVNTAMESQSQTDTDIPGHRTSLPQQTQVDSKRRLSLSEDTYSDCLHLTDLKDPQSPEILMREQPPFDCYETPNNQLSNYELPGFVSPPQHPQKMPTEGISPIITNRELDIDGWDAQFPFVSATHGAQETYFKEAPQSALNSHTPIRPPNFILVSPKELQMPQELLSIYNIDPSSDSSGGGSPNAFHFGQSYEFQQPNSKVTQDFATTSPAAAQSYDINSLLDSFSASPPQSPFNSQTPIPPPSAVHVGQIFESHQTNLKVTRNGSYQVGGSQTYPWGVTLEEGGDMSVHHQILTDQSSDCVLPGFLYPPQHPRTMPMEEIPPIVGNTSFSDSGSELDIHGRGAQLPFASWKHGAQETNSEEFLQSTLNSQTTIPPPNSFLFSAKEQMLQELSSISGTNPSSDSSGGGIPKLFHFGQSYESHQTNFEVTRDGSYQVGVSNTHPRGVTLKEGGDMSVHHQILTDQSSNCVLPGFLYPPQRPGTMPTEEISPIVGNTSFNDRGNELDIHGPAAQLPFPSWKHGAEETNFKEFPQSTLNSQTTIPPPNSFLFSAKEQMLQELSSISGTNPSLDSSGGGIPKLFHFGQSSESHQTNFEVTRDGSYQVGGSNTYLRGVTLEEGGDMSVHYQILTDQSSNCVLPGFLYPPQHPGTMPTEEISPIVGNTSFNDRGNELDIHGPAAQLPFPSWKHGAQETNFRVTQDFATGSSAVIQDLDTGLLFDSFLASPPETGESSLSSSSIVPGGYGTEYCGLPYASGAALDKGNRRISTMY